MTILAWSAGLAIVMHNVVVFYCQRRYSREMEYNDSFNKAWFKYMRNDLMGEQNSIFLLPTLTFVMTVTLCATLVISILVTGATS